MILYLTWLNHRRNATLSMPHLPRHALCFLSIEKPAENGCGRASRHQGNPVLDGWCSQAKSPALFRRLPPLPKP